MLSGVSSNTGSLENPDSFITCSTFLKFHFISRSTTSTLAVMISSALIFENLTIPSSMSFSSSMSPEVSSTACESSSMDSERCFFSRRLFTMLVDFTRITPSGLNSFIITMSGYAIILANFLEKYEA